MSTRAAVPALAPFRVRSYRFQWPADLAASFGFEMENIILGWYILVATGSVLMLTFFAAMQYVGTLFAPLAGVIGHRVGNKRLIATMRGTYALLATTMMTLALTGALAPLHVFVIGTLMGTMRPSDLVMRYALIGQTMPAERLMGATSVSRTTQDSARIAGALAGAGLAAALGTGLAYLVVASLYAASFLLTLGVAGSRAAPPAGAAAPARTSPWRDLRDVVVHVWNTPRLRAVMYVAFLVNMTAFPLMFGLMPYVAKEVYGIGQTGLGYLVASFASGALLGSLVLARHGSRIRSGRMIVAFCLAWYLMILVFARMPDALAGALALVLAGLAQSLCLVPLSAMLLRTAGERYRGGVMGVRQLMIYGVPIGLVTAGPLIAAYGYAATATLYGIIGLAATATIGVRFRAHLWRLDAPANAR
ncbi:MAG: MFS transporter [Burkholderiales bacterium]|nr:MFS transporter [Burkholderiales bacterium]